MTAAPAPSVEAPTRVDYVALPAGTMVGRYEVVIVPDALEAIIWPLLAGLQKVHEVGFLHRDIKPANVMLSATDKATLIDFGASRAAMADRTKTMTAIFTPGFAAPEQFTSARQGP